MTKSIIRSEYNPTPINELLQRLKNSSPNVLPSDTNNIDINVNTEHNNKTINATQESFFSESAANNNHCDKLVAHEDGGGEKENALLKPLSIDEAWYLASMYGTKLTEQQRINLADIALENYLQLFHYSNIEKINYIMQWAAAVNARLEEFSEIVLEFGEPKHIIAWSQKFNVKSLEMFNFLVEYNDLYYLVNWWHTVGEHREELVAHLVRENLVEKFCSIWADNFLQCDYSVAVEKFRTMIPKDQSLGIRL